MQVEVVTPEEFMGEVIGDLNSRRGRVSGMEARGSRRSSPPRCRWPACSVTRRTCASRRRGARPTRCSFRVTHLFRPTSRNRSSSGCEAHAERHAIERTDNGQRKIRPKQAAREHRDDRSRRPRQDDADGGDHEGAGEEELREVPGVRPDRQGAGRARARHHDRDRARGVRDGRSATTRTSIARATPTTSRT